MTRDKEKQMKRAAALKYDPQQGGAPKVVAKGRGKTAQRIIDLAREHQIPLVENPGLVKMLDALNIDAEIPPELYQAVAEVLVFVYRLNHGRL
jgi:flagellar biosynthesis protein